MRLYLDTNAMVYCIEGAAPVRTVVLAKIAQALNTPSGILLTSQLSRLECRVKPMRDGNGPLLATYDTFFSRPSLRVSEITAAIVDRATDLRARFGFKTPDAIHLATAMLENADSFLTGDRDLARCTGLKVDLL